MPTSVTCLWNGQEIDIAQALQIRSEQTLPLFICVGCGERVKAHSGGGHTSAHFEYIDRNPECLLSHSDSYQYVGNQRRAWLNPDSDEAVKGYVTERKYLGHYRNTELVLKCKERDRYTCRSCGFSLRLNGRSIVECHHLFPLAVNGERVTSIDDLICLCPTCHRVAHTSNPPLTLEQLRKLLLVSLMH